MIQFEQKHKDWNGPTTSQEFEAWVQERAKIQEAYIFIAERFSLEAGRLDVVPPKHIIKTISETIRSLEGLLRSYEGGPYQAGLPSVSEGGD